MRKNVFICICFILFFCFLLILNYGLNLGFYKVLSYDEIEDANINKKILLAEYDDKVNNEYKNKENEFRNALQNYNTSKDEYEKLISEGQINEEMIEQYIDIYDLSEISEIIDKYAKEKNTEIDFNVFNSEINYAINSQYTICDISFKVKGEYIDITDFIYSIEDDDRLNFEINDFKLINANDTLEASFNVKNIPVLSKSI